jgi:hypothetical protein
MIDELLGSLLYGLVVFVLFFLCFIIIQPIRRKLFYRNRPDGERRKQLIANIRELRRNGADYHQRLEYLRNQGLRRDVADELLGEVEESEIQEDSHSST